MRQQANGAVASALNCFVARLTRHSPIGGPERDAILSLSSKVTQFPAGADIAPFGSDVRNSSLVVQGVVARFDENADGRRQATALFVPGDACDLPGFRLSQATWGAFAFTACSVLHIPLGEFEHLVGRYPTIERAFWRDMALDASISSKWVGNMALKSGRSRTAHLICELNARMEASGFSSRAPFVLEVTQGRLAEAVGLTPIHMNRVVQDLRSEGLLFPNSRGISVRDWRGLRELAGFDPSYLHLPTRQ